jgi:hypothetical protein
MKHIHPTIWIMIGFGLFVIGGVALMWWAKEEDNRSCRWTQAERLHPDGGKITTECL